MNLRIPGGAQGISYIFAQKIQKNPYIFSVLNPPALKMNAYADL